MGETLRSTAKLRSSGASVSGRRDGTIRAGFWTGVEDEPQPVLEIKPACLRGDVGRRIVQAQVGLEPRRHRFGVDGTTPVLMEAIEHDALESGRSPHLLNDDCAKLAYRARALHAKSAARNG